MFLLVPLLSSPVAAAVTFDTWATTDLLPTGAPTANAGKYTSNTEFDDDGLVVITVTCDYMGSDQTTGQPSPSSYHFAELRIQLIEPVTGTNKTDDHYEVLDSGEDFYGITLEVSDSYQLVTELKWNVSVHAACTNLNTEAYYYYEADWIITVT